jgi:hypothetical protein
VGTRQFDEPTIVMTQGSRWAVARNEAGGGMPPVYSIVNPSRLLRRSWLRCRILVASGGAVHVLLA